MEYNGIAMTIAGSDSGGGAGIQADLKTIQAFNSYGVSVITSITAQNTLGVRSVQDIDPEIVGDQIDAIMEDMGCDAAKTGMLSNQNIIEVIANRIQKYDIKKLIIDPVMVAESGDRLLQEQAEDALLQKLLPLAYLVTPNIYEAEIISGMQIENSDDVKKAAQKIHSLGVRNVLIKGGHLQDKQAADLLFDGNEYQVFETERIDSTNTHGTGCTLSSAITASLARGYDLAKSVEISKEYITRAIKDAPPLGKGHGPLYHNTKPLIE